MVRCTGRCAESHQPPAIREWCRRLPFPQTSGRSGSPLASSRTPPRCWTPTWPSRSMRGSHSSSMRGPSRALRPVSDYLPGAYWDEVATQSWVRLQDPGFSVLWTSLDAPMAALGRLWPGYVSPAHSACIPPRAHHTPATLEDLKTGWIYSLLFANNFGTNFSVSQTGSVLFRHCLAPRAGEMTSAQASRWGTEATTPFETIFTEPRRAGTLPLTDSLLSVEGDPLTLLTCKRAESGRDVILRF